MLLDTDLPYLEPLLFHLRDDEILKKYFNEKSFFMPKDSLISAAKEVMDKDCPSPRALWILPQDSIAISPNPNCKSPVSHTFNIMIFVYCIRDDFQLVKKDGVAHLDGQYIELTAIRKAVKKSVFDFNSINNKIFTGKKFENFVYQKDQMLYPDEKDNFLVSNTEFQVKIF